MNLQIVALSLILTLSLAVLSNAFPDAYATHNDKKKYAEDAKKKAIEELKTKQMNYKLQKELSKKPCFEAKQSPTTAVAVPCKK